MFRIAIITTLFAASVANAQIGGILSTKSTGRKTRNNIGMNTTAVRQDDALIQYGDRLRNIRWNLDVNNVSFDDDLSISTSQQVAGSSGSLALPKEFASASDVYVVRIRRADNYDLPGNATVEISENGTGSNLTTTITADQTWSIRQETIDFWVTTQQKDHVAVSVEITATDGNTRVEIWHPDANIPGVGEDPDDPVHMFHPLYVASLKGFGCLRALNWLPINRTTATGKTYPIVDVSDVVQGDSHSQADGAHGASLDHFLKLATLCNSDVWIPFPHTAGPALIAHWANILKTWKLANPGREIYIEYSNELWNAGTFAQCRVTKTELLGTPLHHASMEYIGQQIWPSEVPTTQRGLAAGRKAGEFFLELDKTLSDSDYTLVFAYQGAVTSTPNLAMDEFAATYGEQPEAIAQAPYITWNDNTQPDGRRGVVRDAIETVTGIPHSSGNQPRDVELTEPDRTDVENILLANYSAEQIIDVLESSPYHGVTLWRTWMSNWQAIANARGARLLMYEGGNHIQPSPTQEAAFPAWGDQFVIAQRHPRMQLLIRKMFRDWFELTGGDLACQLTHVQRIREHQGTFGWLEYLGQTDNAMWQEIQLELKRRR